MTKTQLLFQLCVIIASLVLGAFGVGLNGVSGFSLTNLMLADFSINLSQLMGSIMTICIMKNASTPDIAFILNTSITMGITMGVGALTATPGFGTGGIGANGASAPAADAPELATAATTPALSSGAEVFGAFAKAFCVGLVFGAIKGFIELEVMKAINNHFCPPNSDPNTQCSDTNQILAQA